MKIVRKFTSFEDLKSCRKEAFDEKLSLKKHTEFEKVIKEIYSSGTHKKESGQSK
jgi:hypothetical protein